MLWASTVILGISGLERLPEFLVELFGDLRFRIGRAGVPDRHAAFVIQRHGLGAFAGRVELAGPRDAFHILRRPFRQIDRVLRRGGDRADRQAGDHGRANGCRHGRQRLASRFRFIPFCHPNSSLRIVTVDRLVVSSSGGLFAGSSGANSVVTPLDPAWVFIGPFHGRSGSRVWRLWVSRTITVKNNV